MKYNSRTYQFEIDLSNFDRPVGIDDETWETAKLQQIIRHKATSQCFISYFG